MPRNKKITLLISGLIVLFVFIVIAIICEYVALKDLEKTLSDKTAKIANYPNEIVV